MTNPEIRPRLIDGEKLNRLVKHLLDEADFNRSWTDGRRSPGANVASVYTERRIEAAEEREEWARLVEELRRLLAEAREERDAALKGHQTAIVRMSEAETKWVAEKMRLDFVLSFAQVEDVGDEEMVYGLTFRIEDMENATVGGALRYNWTPRQFIDAAIVRATPNKYADYDEAEGKP